MVRPSLCADHFGLAFSFSPPHSKEDWLITKKNMVSLLSRRSPCFGQVNQQVCHRASFISELRLSQEGWHRRFSACFCSDGQFLSRRWNFRLECLFRRTIIMRIWTMILSTGLMKASIPQRWLNISTAISKKTTVLVQHSFKVRLRRLWRKHLAFRWLKMSVTLWFDGWLIFEWL